MAPVFIKRIHAEYIRIHGRMSSTGEVGVKQMTPMFIKRRIYKKNLQVQVISVTDHRKGKGESQLQLSRSQNPIIFSEFKHLSKKECLNTEIFFIELEFRCHYVSSSFAGLNWACTYQRWSQLLQYLPSWLGLIRPMVQITEWLVGLHLHGVNASGYSPQHPNVGTPKLFFQGNNFISIKSERDEQSMLK